MKADPSPEDHPDISSIHKRLNADNKVKENLATAADAKAPAITPEAHDGTVLVYSISDNLANVNPDSKDTRFADPVPLLPSPEILDAEMAAFHERMANPPGDPPGSSNTQQQTPNHDNLGERQFAAQTA